MNVTAKEAYFLIVSFISCREKKIFILFLQKIALYSKRKIIQDNSQIKNPVIFSELDLGTKGFGKPDGAFGFEIDTQKYFIFVEGKFNQTYQESCSDEKYNSTIKGQIELKMRFVDRIFCSDSRYPQYVIENKTLRGFYKSNDSFYKKRPQGDDLDSFRRVKLKEGVGRLVAECIKPCGRENLLY